MPGDEHRIGNMCKKCQAQCRGLHKVGRSPVALCEGHHSTANVVVHRGIGLVNFFQRDGPGYEVVEIESTFVVEIDELRNISKKVRRTVEHRADADLVPDSLCIDSDLKCGARLS